MGSKKIAVVLSRNRSLDRADGVDHIDSRHDLNTIGSTIDITESIRVLDALSELGADLSCFAPGETGRFNGRPVSSLSELNEADFDAVVFSGVFGGFAANTVLNALSGDARSASRGEVFPGVLPDSRRVLTEFHRSSKPIGAIGRASILIATILGHEHPEITIGINPELAAEIEKTGAQHTACAVDDYVSDRDHKILTTPAEIYQQATPHQIFTGIRRMLTELNEMA